MAASHEFTRTSRRRLILAAAAAAAVTVLPTRAFAGSYLNRSSLLLSHASREAGFLAARLTDRELCRVVHIVAEARLAAARQMVVPKEVVQAHPHLLLVMESYERAARAALDGEPQRFLVLRERARSEERTFRAVLKQLGWELPK